ncbi:S1C family serine protease [Clostridium fallax]|uniref:Serine protease Do n=1 Tax=Clostridium fallax TaxID=1533 RepID=A0A1M4TDX1_9CLOT|nr:trypsin-like peptidase domain-containing protein [Clostridium fallax]SHE42554.1 serine protease Do [Clostridium fallax]SQB22715.1 Periplasmic trypsin-like serine protease (with PDZ domain), HtrA subfamily [Clostridium fallax]
MEEDKKNTKVSFLKKNKNTNENNDEGVINFKQTRGKGKRIKYATLITIIVAISTFSGAVAGGVIVEKRYGLKLQDENKTIFQIVDTRKGSQALRDNQLTRAISKVAPSVVTISDNEENILKGENSCSGIIFREDGYLLTSYSAISKLNNIVVKLPGIGSKPFNGKLIGYDEASDLAVIKIDADRLNAIKCAEKDSAREGEVVLAIGNNVGNEYVGFVTSGIVTCTNKIIEVGKSDSADKKNYKTIQSNAIVNKENNGGVLADVNGEILGVNSTFLTEKYSSEGLSLSIDISECKNIVESIIKFGEVKRAVLGFEGADVNKTENSNIEGVYVQTINPDSSAGRAGLRPTDIIIELDGKKIRGLDDIINILSNHKAGDTLSCKIIRNGDIQNISIPLLDNDENIKQ